MPWWQALTFIGAIMVVASAAMAAGDATYKACRRWRARRLWAQRRKEQRAAARQRAHREAWALDYDWRDQL